MSTTPNDDAAKHNAGRSTEQEDDLCGFASALAALGLEPVAAANPATVPQAATPTLFGNTTDELCDVLPLARAMPFYLANNHDLFGLPRKCNIAVDGGATLSVAADTDGLGFVAARMNRNQAGVA